MWLRLSVLSSTLCAALAIQPGRVVSAQTFGGTPPWGPEKPTAFKGEVRAGQTFERPIGGGLSFRLEPVGEDWDIRITPSGSRDDFAACATGPFHGPNAKQILAWHFQRNQEGGPGGLGQDREIDFVLNSDDQKQTCANLDLTSGGKDSELGSRISGRCWWRPLSMSFSHASTNDQVIDDLTFDAECSLHGALELWRLPATYIFPDDFNGWVTVYYREVVQPELPRTGNEYFLTVNKSGMVFTSSDLRQDARGARFLLKNGMALETEGRDQKIWGWQAGDAGLCGVYQSFFVGTSDQFKTLAANPALKNPDRNDCSGVHRVRAR